jgi:hypothetical protein
MVRLSWMKRAESFFAQLLDMLSIELDHNLVKLLMLFDIEHVKFIGFLVCSTCFSLLTNFDGDMAPICFSREKRTLRANPFPEVTDPFCPLPLFTLSYQPGAVHLGDLMR